VHGANIRAEPGRIGIIWNWNDDLNVVRCAAAFKLRFGLTMKLIMGNEREGTRIHTLSMYSILLPEWFSTMHSTQISGFTCVFSR
jgi:hypothetical protein